MIKERIEIDLREATEEEIQYLKNWLNESGWNWTTRKL